MSTPYNTGKVHIGLTYIPPPARMSSSEEFIQHLLLNKKRPTLWERVKWIIFG